MTSIRVSACLIVDDAGRMLVVRKRGTERFMQPGGKPEPGESARDCVVRELHEELGFRPDPDALEFLGTFTAAAANEKGHDVIADCFFVRLADLHLAPDDVKPAAEIDAVLWLHPGDESVPLAPLTREHLAPIARSRVLV